METHEVANVYNSPPQKSVTQKSRNNRPQSWNHNSYGDNSQQSSLNKMRNSNN